MPSNKSDSEALLFERGLARGGRKLRCLNDTVNTICTNKFRCQPLGSSSKKRGCRDGDYGCVVLDSL